MGSREDQQETKKQPIIYPLYDQLNVTVCNELYRVLISECVFSHHLLPSSYVPQLKNPSE